LQRKTTGGIVGLSFLISIVFNIEVLNNPLSSRQDTTCVNQSFFSSSYQTDFVYSTLRCGLVLKLDPSQATHNLKIPASVFSSSDGPKFITIFPSGAEVKYNCLIVFSENGKKVSILCPATKEGEAFNINLSLEKESGGVLYFVPLIDSPHKNNIV